MITLNNLERFEWRVMELERRIEALEDRMQEKMSLCNYCGNKFYGKRADALFCSSACRQRDSRFHRGYNTHKPFIPKRQRKRK